MRKRKSYWQRRAGFHYYAEAFRLCRAYASQAESVLEGGPRDTRFLKWLAWIPDKVAIDLERKPRVQGARNIRKDFSQFSCSEKFDLVICLQVLEHLDEVEVFARKLLATGNVLVVSLPYRWAKGSCASHRQDPVELRDVCRWFEREPLEHVIVTDNEREGLVAAFQAFSPVFGA